MKTNSSSRYLSKSVFFLGGGDVFKKEEMIA